MEASAFPVVACWGGASGPRVRDGGRRIPKGDLLWRHSSGLPSLHARFGDGLDGRRQVGRNPAEGDVGSADAPRDPHQGGVTGSRRNRFQSDLRPADGPPGAKAPVRHAGSSAWMSDGLPMQIVGAGAWNLERPPGCGAPLGALLEATGNSRARPRAGQRAHARPRHPVWAPRLAC